ncbi:hypothetical protein U5G49_007314 (plasmid) [Rhizobium indigoferae]|uniref:Uncharacterized protein n=1 Tax=Rhizobium indigoferae TaxID=158891 RepID=A0ABZ1DQ60_9HYPH|nr:hypothetical protein [Rhizobium indigoferae]WRW37700.1 hypothetical protein U5G49_007314 [Rhizobium indigoferae]GLR61986.1 hypothetical protein GCM10007919_67160 [Rhizobium indigoferae]
MIGHDQVAAGRIERHVDRVQACRRGMADGLEAAIFPNVKRRHISAVTVDRVEKTTGPLYGEERWIGTCFLDRDQLPLTGLIYTEYRNSLSARVALARRSASDIHKRNCFSL